MRVIWSRPATAELFDIADYYDRIDPDLALDIMTRVQGASAPLLDNPRIGAALDEVSGVRKWRITGTPFLLFYAINGDVIEVRRVRHSASNWRDA